MKKVKLKRMIDNFYAVTIGSSSVSLYHVTTKCDIDNPYSYPVLKKIALKGKSEVLVGEKLSGELLLSIGKDLILYSPHNEEYAIENISNKYWGGNTSNVVALFSQRSVAMKCFNSIGLEPCDYRWIKDTKKILKAIGEKHPKFSICHWPEMALIKEQ